MLLKLRLILLLHIFILYSNLLYFRYGGIYVRVKTDNSSQTLVTLSGYKPGYAPVLLVNNLPTWDIEYGDQVLRIIKLF